jgi:hypothetical protein
MLAKNAAAPTAWVLALMSDVSDSTYREES